MFKRKISEIEKNEIILDYLQDELIHMAANHDPSPEVEPYISHSIAYLQTQINFYSKKLTHLRKTNSKK